jgi:tRNA A37 threonylcarbamoyladenosine synthetase subunit TsaC/SUA5/YrdC
LELAKESPVITTSANKHNSEIAKSMDEAIQTFGSQCAYLDGEKPMGVESTIIDLTQDKPKIKRIGALYSSILEGIIEF